MEKNNKDEIAEISEELIKLLKDNDEKFWSEILENIQAEYIKGKSKSLVANEFIIIMRGGMGSFLDLVLHENKKPLIEENNKLDELRYKLYKACKKIT